jgi:hypothetical protein
MTERKVAECFIKFFQAVNNKMVDLLTDIRGELRAMRVGTGTSPVSNASFAAVVTRAMTTDRAVIEEKAKNAVFIGVPEKTEMDDKRLVLGVIQASGDVSLSAAVASGGINFQRYPNDKPPPPGGRPRIIKVHFPTQQLRDSYIRAGRTNRPPAMTNLPHAFLRRDYTIDEQKLDGELRKQCGEVNKAANEISVVVRDLRIHKLTKPRPLEPRAPVPGTGNTGNPARTSRNPATPSPAPQLVSGNRRNDSDTAPGIASIAHNIYTVLTEADLAMDETY